MATCRSFAFENTKIMMARKVNITLKVERSILHSPLFHSVKFNLVVSGANTTAPTSASASPNPSGPLGGVAKKKRELFSSRSSRSGGSGKSSGASDFSRDHSFRVSVDMPCSLTRR